MIIDILSLDKWKRQDYLQHAIAPRPICFASTIDKQGIVNLSPFSFFNLVSTSPPIVLFSPCRRVRDNTIKHTLQNVMEIPQVVINIVDDNMVQQVSLASCDFPKNVNEFSKAGFTEEAATIVQPPMVKESKIKMECRVIEIKPLGNEGGSGTLVLCEVLVMHIDETVLTKTGLIDQKKLHHIARLGANWYSVVNETNLFEVEKPNTRIGIGIDQLPQAIRTSFILTGNHLGQLANLHDIPLIDAAFEDETLKSIFQYFSGDPGEMELELHRYAGKLLDLGKVHEAWQVLLSL